MRPASLTGLAAMLCLAGAAGPPRPRPSPDPVVLVSAGRAVRASELRSAVLQIPDPPEREGMALHPRRAARWYGRMVALAGAATHLGLSTPELRRYPLLQRDQGLAARLMRYLAGLAKPTLAQEQRYYAAHRRRFTLVQVSMLLISDRQALNPRSNRTPGAARARAWTLASRLRQGADFATLARDDSDDPATRAGGGDLGFLGPRQVPPALSRVLARLGSGRISAPFRTPFGWEIARAGRRRQTPFAAVRGQIASLLRGEEMERRLGRIVAAANITLRPKALEMNPMLPPASPSPR